MSADSKSVLRILAVMVAVTVSVVARAEDPSLDGQTNYRFFENRIRPVLVEHCYECHSGDQGKHKGGLRIDSREAIRTGGDSGPAIQTEHPLESLLLQAIRYESLEMPPQGKLSPKIIADFEKWISEGAPDPRDGSAVAEPESQTNNDPHQPHWAFAPIVPHHLPTVVRRSWPRDDLDYFVLHRLETVGMSPAADATRYRWLRRVSLDLTGLPPSLDEIRRFERDRSAHAETAVVDRLLSSPAFGEKWARHWLDLVGYADQIGTSNDIFAEHAWRYRNYVIDAINDDKPFDRFVQEQIAGDLLPYESVAERTDQLTATGFLLLGDVEIVEADKAKLLVDVIDQQIVKMSNAFLAMTVGCARCHDHKFDPISQRDYYALGGIFRSTDSIYQTGRGVWSSVTSVNLPETSDDQIRRNHRSTAHQQKLQQLTEKRDTLLREQEALAHESAAESNEETQKPDHEEEQLRQEIARLDNQIKHANYFSPRPPQAYSVHDADGPADMQITIRGNPRALGDLVARDHIEFLKSTQFPDIPSHESGRRQLAEWLTDSNNPLPARVVVNRIWQQLFGTGLVSSVDYFGVRGEQPSHPKLLDHLASTFISQGWSQKQLIRRLVLSRTYRMSSRPHAEYMDVDPENRLLWRMTPRRLSAESLRDSLLFVTDQLSRSRVNSALPLEYVENVGGLDPKNVNPPHFRLNKWRPDQPFQRTVFLPVVRSAEQPGPADLRNVFDFTQPATYAGQRSVTAVPTQALFLMNSESMKKFATAMAEQLKNASGDRLDLLWWRVLNRPIDPQERAQAIDFLANSDHDWSELCHALLASNEFLMVL